jgi:VanZ family protein
LRKQEPLRRWLPALAWASLIWLMSTGWFSGDRTAAIVLPVLATLFPGASPAELRAIHQGIRKLAHFTEYLVLSVLLYRALRTGRGWNFRAAGLAFTIAGVYALSDEFHQWFVPGRTAAATDCLIDVSGAAAAQGFLAARSRGSGR